MIRFSQSQVVCSAAIPFAEAAAPLGDLFFLLSLVALSMPSRKSSTCSFEVSSSHIRIGIVHGLFGAGLRDFCTRVVVRAYEYSYLSHKLLYKALYPHMAVKERTHDISLIDHHVKDVATLSDILNQSLSAAFPRATRSRYHDVYVLLLSWEDDDLGVESEINELDYVFENVYRYRTDQWRIPTSKSHNALVRRVMEALEEAEARNVLLVVYYGGHGYMNDDRHCVWLW